ncbi:hypothetical protein HanRHA438_Chr08g0329311 [Helianthus annuus]|nr:hypothetical protein HanRHA438_Chr08g0329311 [Helianthus annuus]
MSPYKVKLGRALFYYLLATGSFQTYLQHFSSDTRSIRNNLRKNSNAGFLRS